MLELLINYLWCKIEPSVDLHITGRLVTFHSALIQRGQIRRPPKELVSESFIADCNQDHVPQ
jgi:hypothetical protein